MPYRLILACLFCLFAGPGLHAQQAPGPGAFDYFLLALSWSPQYCVQHGRQASARDECHGPQAHGFIAHGLWPEDDSGASPKTCRPPSPLPDRLLERMMPIMPSAQLVAHEWTVHGSCSGLSADDYFDRLSQAFRKVQIPARLARPDAPIGTDVTHVRQWFQEANPGLQTNMLTIQCDPRDAALREVRFCMGKNLDFRPCIAAQTDHCPGGSVRIAPVP